MKTTLRLCALLLTACLLLTGCADLPASDAGSTGVQTDVSYTDVLAGLQQTTDTGLAKYTDTFEMAAMMGGHIWAVGSGWQQATAADEPVYAQLLLRADADGGNAVRMPAPLPQLQPEEGFEQDACISALLPTADGTMYALCLLRSWPQDTPQDQIPEVRTVEYRLLTLEGDGALAGSSPLPQVSELGGVTDAATVDGTAWLLGPEGLLRLELAAQDGQLYPAPPDYANQLQVLADGRVLAMGPGREGGYSCWLLDTDGTWGEALTLPEEFALARYGQLTAVRPYNCLAMDAAMTWDSNGIYRWDVDTAACEPLFYWIDSGVGITGLLDVFLLQDGKFLLVSMDTAAQALSFTTLVPASAEILASRRLIRVGATDQVRDQVKQAVQQFNASNEEIYVKLVRYELSGDQSGGATPLEKDILTGNAPDVVLMDVGLTNNHHLRQGLYIDMYPLLDADPQLSREDFVTNVLRLGEFNGQLCSFIAGYDIFTAYGDADVVGAQPGWTYDEYQKVLAANPGVTQPFYRISRQLALLYTVEIGGDRFIDWETGRAALDTPAMEQALADAARYPTDDELNRGMQDAKELMATGQHLLYPDLALTNFNVLRELYYIFDGDYTLKGFPGESGCGSAVVPRLRFGITRQCQDVDAAWAFARTLLLPGLQDTLCSRAATRRGTVNTTFPLRRDSLQKAAEEATQPFDGSESKRLVSRTAGEAPAGYWNQGVPMEQCQKLLDLIDRVDAVYQYDDVLDGILQEEAAAYFSGQRTASETAAIMQDRIQTYLDEQS